MKIGQGMKIINNVWIQKPKGFRVKYQKLVDSELVTEYSPGLDDEPLDSDVTTWRYAWKLYVSTKSDKETIQEDEMVNVTVVDNDNNNVNYYITGAPEIYNTKIS
jgi:hypothetical protein